MGVIYNIAGWK